MEELDKVLNRKSGFRYIASGQFDASQHVRLLRSVSYTRSGPSSYILEIVPLKQLIDIRYRALSYTWGLANSLDDVREIRVDGQYFFIRRNLFDFLEVAAAQGERGLLFIDAICVNQTDHGERQTAVQEMAHIYRNANEVIAWLVLPGRSGFDDVHSLDLAQVKDKDRKSWTASEWAGLRYLSFCPYWSRVWILQEILLASKVRVWCGNCIFPLTLFNTTTPTLPPAKIKIDENGRPTNPKLAISRLRSPAEVITTHRLRLLLRPAEIDILEQGTKVRTLAEIKKRSAQTVYCDADLPIARSRSSL